MGRYRSGLLRGESTVLVIGATQSSDRRLMGALMSLTVTQAIVSIPTGDGRHERDECTQPSEPVDDLVVIECVEGGIWVVAADLTKVPRRRELRVCRGAALRRRSNRS